MTRLPRKTLAKGYAINWGIENGLAGRDDAARDSQWLQSDTHHFQFTSAVGGGAVDRHLLMSLIRRQKLLIAAINSVTTACQLRQSKHYAQQIRIVVLLTIRWLQRLKPSRQIISTSAMYRVETNPWRRIAQWPEQFMTPARWF